jgi:23S rRNA pseudouridine2605 synthase
MRNERSAPERGQEPGQELGVRLEKALADAGVGPRRDCEQLIFEGKVRVNGKPVRMLPHFVDPARDFIEVNGEPVDVKTRREIAPVQSVYLLVNKPKGVVVTSRESDRSVLKLVPHSLLVHGRLHPVGGLETESTGLLLMTNDAELSQRLTHPKLGLVSEYRMGVAGVADEEHLAQLKRGMYLITPDKSGEKTAKRASLDSVRVVKRLVDRNRGSGRTLLSVSLREGQNREIRRMLARVGLKVRELERVALGPLRNPSLRPGETKLLGKRDVQKLRDATLG